MIAFARRWFMPAFWHCLGIGFGLGLGFALGGIMGFIALLNALPSM